MGRAFEKGVGKVVQESSTGQPNNEESGRLKRELSFLREKLGFQKRASFSSAMPRKSKKLSSRQIPVGKNVRITRRKTRDSDDIECTVVTNDEGGLSIQLSSAVKVTFGEFWCVRYYFGASVWEFEASVVSYDGDVLVLEHSDDVRFINRRRFLRVPVKKPAFVARFPFSTTVVDPVEEDEEESEVEEEESTETDVRFWGPPEFVPAVVTEMAGPGLRFESSLEFEAGERVLVVFNLDKEAEEGPVESSEDKPTSSKVVEDVGEIRHTRAIENGWSAAVELTGVSDSEVDELVRATNAASLKAGGRKRDGAEPAGAGKTAGAFVSVEGK
jgi:hypothetical protein